MWSFSAKPCAFSTRPAWLDVSNVSWNIGASVCKRRTTCHAIMEDGVGTSPVSIPNVSNGSWMAFNEPPVWRGDEDAFMRAAPCLELPPAVKSLLLSDGSMTRHISLLMMEEVIAEPLKKPQVPDGKNIPELCNHLLKEPILQREVFLRTESSETLVYAASWWNRETLASFFVSWDEPVGSKILSSKMETHREIDQVYLGESAELCLAFGEEGPFWGRLYVLWSGGKPLCVMHEVLSHQLFQRAAIPSNLQRLERMNGKGFDGNGAKITVGFESG